MPGSARGRSAHRRRGPDRARRGRRARRPALLPPDRGGEPAGRRDEGARGARLGAAAHLRRARHRDGRPRPRRGAARRPAARRRLRHTQLPRVTALGASGHRRRSPRPQRRQRDRPTGRVA